MSRWDEKFSSHQIHTTIREAREFLQTKHKDLSPEAEVEKRRFLKVVDRIEAITEQIDAETVPFTLLDNINSGIRNQNIWNQLSTYANNGQVSHLTNANNALNAQLGSIEHLASALTPEAVIKNKKPVEKSFDEFVKAIGERRNELIGELDEVKAEKTQLEQKLQALEAKIAAKSNETDQLTSVW